MIAGFEQHRYGHFSTANYGIDSLWSWNLGRQWCRCADTGCSKFGICISRRRFGRLSTSNYPLRMLKSIENCAKNGKITFTLEWNVEYCCWCWNGNNTSHNSTCVQFDVGTNHWIRCESQWQWGAIKCPCAWHQSKSNFNKCFLWCGRYTFRVHSYRHTIATAIVIWWKQHLQFARDAERWKCVE